MTLPGQLTDALVVPALRINRGEGLAEALRCLREFDPRVFLIFGGDAEDIAWLHETLEDQAGHPVLFCADLERGAGQQFDGLTPLPDAWALGILGAEASFDAGRRVACEAAQAGVRWILGPVLDLHSTLPNAVCSPIIGHRAFSGDPDRVVEIAGAWIRGVKEGGGLACAKHFPGHGACPQDSHVESALALVDLEFHLKPFQELLPELPAIMVGHIECPALDEESRPATRSKPVIDLLRKDWGYEGILVTDSLRMAGFGSGPHPELARESLHAGLDLLLDPEDPVVLAVSLRDSLERGDLDPATVERAVRRVDRFLKAAGELPTVPPKPLMLGGGARRLLRPLPGGSPGRQIPRPELALGLAGSRDSISFLTEWGIEVLSPTEPPPDPMPQALVILWGAAEGHGFPSLPGPWAEAVSRNHTVLYVAGSPEAAQSVPAHSPGLYLPGLSPALLALLFTEGEE